MAEPVASDFAFSPPQGGGDGSAGMELGWVDPRTWLSFQGPPRGPGIELGAEVLGISPCPQAHELCEGMAYCGPQVGLGLVLQVGVETLQPEGQAGARVENNSEGASSGPCAACPSTPQCCAVGEGGTKSRGVPGHESPAAARAICQAAEAEENHLGVHPGRRGAHPGCSLWKGVQPNNPLPPCSSALRMSIENLVRWNLENKFLKCPKPSLQQILG